MRPRLAFDFSHRVVLKVTDPACTHDAFTCIDEYYPTWISMVPWFNSTLYMNIVVYPFGVARSGIGLYCRFLCGWEQEYSRLELDVEGLSQSE